MSEDQEAAVVRFGKAAGWRQRSFTEHQRSELLKLGLFEEQVARLEGNALARISWRRTPAPRMDDVRHKLTELVKLLGRIERLYTRMSVSPTGASAEVMSRLYMAQEALGFDPLRPGEQDKLHDSLETATNIVRRALEELAQIQRRNPWPSSQFVGFIRKALELGHVEHYRCSGYGDAPPEPEPVPPFLIKVTRTRKANRRRNRVPPFGEIARIVSAATGGWSSDDAIREYQRLHREKGGK